MLLSGENFFSTPSCGGTVKAPWDLQESGGKRLFLGNWSKGVFRRMWSNLLIYSEITHLTSYLIPES